MPLRTCLSGLLLFVLVAAARAEGPTPGDFKPDPRSVQRYGPP
jgi:hypothetical protein